ncbi:MAG: TrkA family potassium uptake protein [Bacillota bacterium]
MKLVVVGCGSMGSHLALALARGGHLVSVIDSDPSARARLGSSFGGKFISGVAIDLGILAEAGIDAADGLAAVTGSDETNLAVAMLARKRFRVPKVIARVFEPGKMVGYRAAGIHVVCPPAWGFRVIGDILTNPARDVAATFGHGEVQVVALAVGESRPGLVLSEVTSPPDIIAVALVRNGVALVPPPGFGLEPGDILYVRVPEPARGTFDRMVRGLGV